MAAYDELYSIWYDSGLKNRVTVAVVISAQAIQDENPVTPNHANRLIWAQQTFQNPSSSAEVMFRVILAVNKDLAVETILSASDTTIQSAVDDAVNTFAIG